MADEPGPQDIELVKCPRCERIFSRTLAAVCPECFQDEADEFDKVRDVLETEPALNAYVQGRNIACIQATVQQLAILMNTPMDISELSEVTLEFERELESFVKKRPDLARQIRKLEQTYEDQSADPTNEDMQDWFNKQDIQLD